MTRTSLSLSKGKLSRFVAHTWIRRRPSLGSRRHINHVFDLMWVEYDDRPVLVELKDDASDRAKGKKPISMKGNKATKAKAQRPIARKWKASEPGDVRLGLELAK
jgi:hypothetical protein